MPALAGAERLDQVDCEHQFTWGLFGLLALQPRMPVSVIIGGEAMAVRYARATDAGRRARRIVTLPLCVEAFKEPVPSPMRHFRSLIDGRILGPARWRGTAVMGRCFEGRAWDAACCADERDLITASRVPQRGSFTQRSYRLSCPALVLC